VCVLDSHPNPTLQFAYLLVRRAALPCEDASAQLGPRAIGAHVKPRGQTTPMTNQLIDGVGVESAPVPERATRAVTTLAHSFHGVTWYAHDRFFLLMIAKGQGKRTCT
jgi:hypothetical protein